MIKKYLSIALAAMFFSAASCTYDDTDIRNKVDELDSRLTELEQVVKQLNTNVGSLMTIVNALENQIRIESVTTLSDGSGYVILFSDSSRITVSDGKNGADGSDGDTPVVSIGKDIDGLYYWKVNGEWLLDGENKIPATSKAEIPLIRVNEITGNFELSFDGENWQDIGSAGGAGIFKDVIDGEDEVIFILSGDKDPIIIPKAQQFALNISKGEFAVTPGGQLSIPYTISAVDAGTAISVLATEGFKASVNYNFDNDVSSGNILVEIPEPLTDGKVFVFAVNGKGTPSARILSFEAGEFMAMEMGDTNIPAEGGELMVFVQTNYDYNVIIPEDAQSWISYQFENLTRVVREDFMTFVIAPNNAASQRSAEIKLRDDNYVVYHTITITQDAGSGEQEPGYYQTIEDWEYDGTLQLL